MPKVLPHLVLLTGTLCASMAWADNQPPVIGFEPCSAFQRGKSLMLVVAISDESPIFEPKIVYRTKSDGAWKSVPLAEEDGLWKATIPARELKSSVEYFVEAFDENGNGPARVGTPDQPLTAKAHKRAEACPQPARAVAAASVPVRPAVSSGDGAEEAYTPRPAATEVNTARGEDPVRTSSTPAKPVTSAPPPASGMTAVRGNAPPKAERSSCDEADPPVYCKVWFWVVVGGVVAGGAGAAAYFLTRPAEQGSIPDYVTISVTAPSPTTGNPLSWGAR